MAPWSISKLIICASSIRTPPLTPPNEPETQPEAPAVQEPAKPFGFVAVAAGQGLKELFLELGADQVVSGGQTMNPSTEDILDAIMATPAEHVFRFYPINKNIIYGC